MGKIPVAVVDDNEADRYIVKRRLAKASDFGEVTEAVGGIEFLAEFFNGQARFEYQDQPLLVLMDVNMPGMNGFETVEELQRRVEAGKGPASMVIMMFTSSTNPNDLAQAKKLKSVKGYVNKPLDDAGLKVILKMYHS